MASQETRTDKLSVFHKITKKHAGTLVINEIKYSTGAVSMDWDWTGGPQGKHSGTAQWHHENPVLFLFSLSFAQARLVSNPTWVGIARPPMRPWFKWFETLELVDYEMKKEINPNYTPWFRWDLKIISAAQS